VIGRRSLKFSNMRKVLLIVPMDLYRLRHLLLRPPGSLSPNAMKINYDSVPDLATRLHNTRGIIESGDTFWRKPIPFLRDENSREQAALAVNGDSGVCVKFSWDSISLTQ
jgi:hypothetical protein